MVGLVNGYLWQVRSLTARQCTISITMTRLSVTALLMQSAR